MQVPKIKRRFGAAFFLDGHVERDNMKMEMTRSL
jgi:prepilin-type processing-associated H-X9-DG protein